MNTSDRYISFSNSGLGKWITGAVGLPRPTPLMRAEDSGIDIRGPVLCDSATNGTINHTLSEILDKTGTKTFIAKNYNREKDGPAAALIYDASGITEPEQLSALYDFFHNNIRSSGRCSRALVIGTLPETADSTHTKIIQRSLEGFIKSLGKEMRHGSTAQLLFVAEGAENLIESSIRFFLSPKSAYVSAQVVRIKPGSINLQQPDNHEKPNSGRIALVTGASRGIGAAIAETLARDGAHVIALDVPKAKDELDALANRLGGSSLAVDITADNATEEILNTARAHGGLDIVVHNAGITRDKTIANMNAGQWDSVVAVNLTAPIRITESLLSEGAIKNNGRIICLSSVNGIAGSAGQTNYGLTKAGIIGLIETLAPDLTDGITINAVAPGFIETQMTAAIPFAMREIARRMNSLQQGGLPVDVAETIAWLAHPGSSGINGSVIRTCGQSIVGA